MILSLLLLGVVLRLINIDQSLWLDEAINIMAAKNYSLWGMITEYAKADFHPPGYFIILWSWGRVFGFSEISTRIPSVILGLLTIFLVYLIGKKLISKELGLISAALLAVNPLHIYYSQEARMYSLSAFAVSLNIFLFLKLLKHEKISLFFLFLSNLLVLSSDYVACLIFPAEFIALFLIKQSKLLKKWFICLLVSGLVSTFWIPIFLSQIAIGKTTSLNIPAWKEVVGTFSLKSLDLTYVKFIIGRISYPNLFIYTILFLPVGFLFLFLFWRAIKFSNDFAKKFLISWLLVPIFLTSLISVSLPIYSYFRLLFILPSFLILACLGILSFKSQLKFFFLFLLILVEIICSFIYLFNPTFQRENWRDLVNFLESKPEGKILFESSGSFAPFDYYADGKIKGIGALKNFPAKDSTDLIDLESSLNGTLDVYLINYLVEISDPRRLIQSQLNRLNYKQTEIKNFNGVGFVYHYVKNE